MIYRKGSDKPCQLTKFKGWSFRDSWHENVAVLMNSDNELSRKTEDLFSFTILRSTVTVCRVKTTIFRPLKGSSKMAKSLGGVLDKIECGQQLVC